MILSGITLDCVGVVKTHGFGFIFLARISDSSSKIKYRIFLPRDSSSQKPPVHLVSATFLKKFILAGLALLVYLGIISETHQ